MSRAPVRAQRASAVDKPYCPENDCQREQARALTRLADVSEAALAEFEQLKPTLHSIGEVVGKWLRFCAFMRKWFPRVGWWLIPLAMTVVTRGGSEATDALIQAVTAYLQMQAGAAG